MTAMLDRTSPGTHARAAQATPEPPARPTRPAAPGSGPSVFALLAGAAVLYLWNLTASGYGNEFYAAATQAATQSWKAWLFGSLDSGNAHHRGQAARVPVGERALRAASSASPAGRVLAPQALEGVAAVGMLYLTVRRTSGRGRRADVGRGARRHARSRC